MTAGKKDYVKYASPFAAIPPQTVQLLVQRGIGRNGWAVMVALCMGTHVNGRFDIKPAKRIAELTGLNEKQVSRGVAELRKQKIIAPIAIKKDNGDWRLDRSCFGHVATYCFTRDAWEAIAEGLRRDGDGT